MRQLSFPFTPASMNALDTFPSLKHTILPGVQADGIVRRYYHAGGNEIGSGKFFHPESSAALVANTFGFFLDQPRLLPPIPGLTRYSSDACFLDLEHALPMPWRSGGVPWLDAIIETKTAIIGIEAKRFEPFRLPSMQMFSPVYWRAVWGSEMSGYQLARDQVRSNSSRFQHFQAAQIVKHALGMKTLRALLRTNKTPIILYLFHEPTTWSDGTLVCRRAIHLHRKELREFSKLVKRDSVRFYATTYRKLTSLWDHSPYPRVREHAANVEALL